MLQVGNKNVHKKQTNFEIQIKLETTCSNKIWISNEEAQK